MDENQLPDQNPSGEKPSPKSRYSQESLITLYALAVISVTYFFILLPISYDIGFTGDDWSMIFGQMDKGASLWENFLSGAYYYSILNRPTFIQPLSLAIMHAMFGDAPTGYAASAFFGLAICSFALGLLTLKITRSSLAAVLASLAFCSLPINNQALFHITAGIGKWQGALYFLLSAYFYINSMNRPLKESWKSILGSALFFALTLACYEQSMAFLPLYPLMHILWARRFSIKFMLAGRYWWHVLIGAAYVWLRAFYYKAMESGGYHIEFPDIKTIWTWILNPWTRPNIKLTSHSYEKIWTSIINHHDAFLKNSLTYFLILLIPCIIAAIWARKKTNVVFRPQVSNAFRLIILGAAVFYFNHALFIFLSTWMSERNILFPTIGIALSIGGLCALLHSYIAMIPWKIARAILTTALIGSLCYVYSLQTTERIAQADQYRESGRITRAVYSSLKSYRGQITGDDNIVVLGTPWTCGGTWTFTANYAISGCARRALDLPLKGYLKNYAQIALHPVQEGYDHFLNIRNYPFGGYVTNIYTQCDNRMTREQKPLKSYENLDLFLFTDRYNLVRVSELTFDDENGTRRSVALRNLRDPLPPVSFHLPRIALVSSEAPDFVNEPENGLDAGQASLMYADVTRHQWLFNSYLVRLVWKKTEDELTDSYHINVYMKDQTGDRRFRFITRVSDDTLATQLCGTTWSKDEYLTQNFLYIADSCTPNPRFDDTLDVTAQIDIFTNGSYIRSVAKIFK